MLRASTTFFAGDRLVQAGEIVSGSDPIVKGREALFTPVQVTFPTVAPVEQATQRFVLRLHTGLSALTQSADFLQ